MGRLRVTMAACLLAVLLAEMSSAADETVLVTSTAVFPMIPSKQEMKNFQVLLSVEAPRKGQRVHTDIIVVHRISSEKGLFTKASKAIESICKQLLLTEYKDKDKGKLAIKIVGPSKDINKPPAVRNLSNPHEAKKPMENQSSYSAGGATLGVLLKVAITDMDDSGRTGQAERAGAIIVLTDGSESLGGEVKDLFKDKNYAVHAFGLGADHNATALHDLASASTGGTYSFVDNDDPGNITAALAVCVGGHNKVLVPGTSTLELKAEPGVTIKEIQYGSSLHTPNDDPTKPIKIGALHAGETKKILVSLDLPAEGNPDDKDSGCSAKTLLTAVFMRSSNDKAPTTRAVCVERPRGVPALGQGAPPSPLVLEQIVRTSLVHTLISSIRDKPPVLEKLKVELDKFVTTHQYWSGLDIFLGGLHQEIVTMQKYASDSPFWVHYITSWISSHEAQRPTAMGSSDNVVGVFLTQEVNIMVQVAIQVTNNMDIFCQEYSYGGELKCVDANRLVDVISKALNEKGLLCSNNDANSGDARLAQ